MPLPPPREPNHPSMNEQTEPPPPPPDTERPDEKRRWGRRSIGALVLAAALVAGGFYLGEQRGSDRGSAAPVVDLSGSDEEPVHSTTAGLIEAALPSVVHIKTTSVGFDPFGGTSETEGQGSGVVIDSDGVILTNNHVVAGAVEVEVVFNDEEHEPMSGTVLGTDPQHDLAIVKVDAGDLQPLQIGNSGDLKLGDTVVAIGFPLGLGGPTVTKGIVSGLDRSIQAGGGASAESFAGMLQTDAAINPGNSGGPLIDEAGRLVGINTAAAQAGDAENVGFAIPIDEAAPIAEQIVNEPESRRAWLGVQIASLRTSAEAAQIGVPLDTRGALILGVIEGGGAEDAGLEEGDVIVAIDDRDVESSADLTEILAESAAGDEVELAVVSSEGSKRVTVELTARPSTL